MANHLIDGDSLSFVVSHAGDYSEAVSELTTVSAGGNARLSSLTLPAGVYIFSYVVRFNGAESGYIRAYLNGGITAFNYYAEQRLYVNSDMNIVYINGSYAGSFSEEVTINLNVSNQTEVSQDVRAKLIAVRIA